MRTRWVRWTGGIDPVGDRCASSALVAADTSTRAGRGLPRSWPRSQRQLRVHPAATVTDPADAGWHHPEHGCRPGRGQHAGVVHSAADVWPVGRPVGRRSLDGLDRSRPVGRRSRGAGHRARLRGHGPGHARRGRRRGALSPGERRAGGKRGTAFAAGILDERVHQRRQRRTRARAAAGRSGPGQRRPEPHVAALPAGCRCGDLDVAPGASPSRPPSRDLNQVSARRLAPALAHSGRAGRRRRIAELGVHHAGDVPARSLRPNAVRYLPRRPRYSPCS